MIVFNLRYIFCCYKKYNNILTMLMVIIDKLKKHLVVYMSFVEVLLND